MIGRSGERGSGISVLAARHDDDDCCNHQTCIIIKHYLVHTHTHTHTHIYIYIYIYIYIVCNISKKKSAQYILSICVLCH